MLCKKKLIIHAVVTARVGWAGNGQKNVFFWVVINSKGDDAVRGDCFIAKWEGMSLSLLSIIASEKLNSFIHMNLWQWIEKILMG